jgi:BASS family bile acid:Na+ symporter
MKAMTRLLSIIGGRATQFLFAGVFIGLLLPDLAALARPLLAPSVGLMLGLTLLRVDWRRLGRWRMEGLRTTLAIAWIVLLSPCLVWLCLLPDFLPSSLTAALVLMAAAPPIIGAVSIALFLDLDAELALVIALLATLIAPLTLPPLAGGLLGLDLDFDIFTLMVRMAALVAVAFIGAFLVRRMVGAARLAANAARIDGAVVITMLIFAIAIMDGVGETLWQDPRTVLLWTAAAFIANPVLQGLGAAFFAASGRKAGVTLGLLSGNRNMGLVLASLPPGADEGIVLFFALAQIPMYTLPALLRPVYRAIMR